MSELKCLCFARKQYYAIAVAWGIRRHLNAAVVRTVKCADFDPQPYRL